MKSTVVRPPWFPGSLSFHAERLVDPSTAHGLPHIRSAAACHLSSMLTAISAVKLHRLRRCYTLEFKWYLVFPLTIRIATFTLRLIV